MKKTILALTFIAAVSMFAFASGHGADIYAKCKGCHGADGSKEALGVGAPLKGQSASDIVKKLHGYKDGSYGGSKKSIMKGQANRLSDDEMKAVAEYISKF